MGESQRVIPIERPLFRTRFKVAPPALAGKPKAGQRLTRGG
jgi:hypothetical protein